MAPFINLFNGQLQSATGFSENINSDNLCLSVITLLRGIRDTPTAYGLDDIATHVAGAFVNNRGLIDIIVLPVNVNNMEIPELGRALGYVFSRQRAA
ncbi:hypothetical protein Q9L58_009602 [Maublancomyces gigas]|uniref:Uncharacterized protein n=1 Tax=Discina gigas TaxID=1032678 RepID=A0ABR3G6E0_9PEZI